MMEQVQLNTKPLLESTWFKVLVLDVIKDKLLTIMSSVDEYCFWGEN